MSTAVMTTPIYAVWSAIAALAAVSIATTTDVEATLEGIAPIPDSAIALWSVGPGLIGGLAMQLVSETDKSRRLFAGEMLCSGIAGFIGGVISYRWLDGWLELAAIGILAGSGGSRLVVLGAAAFESRFGSLLIAIFGGEQRHDGSNDSNSDQNIE